ncbi:MAG: hypothetical protein ACLSH3_07960 [Alistipes finegoldii]
MPCSTLRARRSGFSSTGIASLRRGSRANLSPYTFETPAIDLPAGKYTWGIAIVDTTKENVPAIELAVNDEKTAEGWVKLLDVQIH